ncbi:hypothetical protein QQS21_004790 [Conoideocrella luteorostrata]|uniref:Uncharacterized protein n=1 Tax=Conoideocrella luteorostrata TaxID=1105319 RepID=A0AAJ0CT45_9HYPO|nr:hypothetical protein QQS21_004790 [Conoideocrella luteorostrata]
MVVSPCTRKTSKVCDPTKVVLQPPSATTWPTIAISPAALRALVRRPLKRPPSLQRARDLQRLVTVLHSLTIQNFDRPFDKKWSGDQSKILATLTAGKLIIHTFRGTAMLSTPAQR